MRKALAIIAMGIITTVLALAGGGIADGEVAGHSWRKVGPVEVSAPAVPLKGHSWR